MESARRSQCMHYSTQHFCVRISMMPREVSSRQINRFLQATTCHRALLRRLNVAADVCCASFVPMRRLFDGRMLFIQLQLCSCINSIQLVASPPHGITFLLRPVQCSRVRVPLLLLDASAERSVHDLDLHLFHFCEPGFVVVRPLRVRGRILFFGKDRLPLAAFGGPVASFLHRELIPSA